MICSLSLFQLFSHLITGLVYKSDGDLGTSPRDYVYLQLICNYKDGFTETTCRPTSSFYQHKEALLLIKLPCELQRS